MKPAGHRRRGRRAIVVALVATAGLVVLGTASFYRGTARSRPVVPPFDLFWCQRDEDCTLVERIGCCSCVQGGAQAAVTRWHVDDLRRFLKSACRPEQVCVRVDLCRADWVARCVDRHCVLGRRDE